MPIPRIRHLRKRLFSRVRHQRRLLAFLSAQVARLAPTATAQAVGSVVIGTDQLVITGHGFQTGDGPVLAATAGTLPAPLLASTPYHVIRVDNDNIRLADTRALAIAGTAIDLTTIGTGAHTITRQVISSSLFSLLRRRDVSSARLNSEADIDNI